MLTSISVYDRWVGSRNVTNEELLDLEVFTSENAITDHFDIKEEMRNRGLEIINRDDWGTNIVGIFINQEVGTNE